MFLNFYINDPWTVKTFTFDYRGVTDSWMLTPFVGIRPKGIPFFPGFEAEDLTYHPGVRNIILTDVRLMTLVDRYGLLAYFSRLGLQRKGYILFYISFDI